MARILSMTTWEKTVLYDVTYIVGISTGEFSKTVDGLRSEDLWLGFILDVSSDTGNQLTKSGVPSSLKA